MTTISLDPLISAALELEQHADALRLQAAGLEGEARGLRRAAQLIAEQATPSPELAGDVIRRYDDATPEPRPA
jgi:hypothetical protein